MNRQTWFVTGAASRLGADTVRAALAAGHRVVAADADPLAVLQRVGQAADERLLALALDEVDASEAGAAVKAAVARFGGIDVLVHGAAECSPQGEFEPPAPARDFSASVRALFNITRAALATMRAQGSGRIHHLVPEPGTRRPALFSIAGFCQAVAADAAPFGIEVTPVAAYLAPRLPAQRSAQGRDESLGQNV